MKSIIAVLLLILCSWQLEARERGVNLNDAVNQAKKEGKVLSARTINGQHEIKVLTPNGTVKTIQKKANRSSRFANSNSGNHDSRNTFHDQLFNQSLDSRRNSNSSRNSMRLKQRNARANRNAERNNSARNAERVPRQANKNKKDDN